MGTEGVPKLIKHGCRSGDSPSVSTHFHPESDGSGDPDGGSLSLSGERKELAIRVSRIPDLGSRESLLPARDRIGSHGGKYRTRSNRLPIRQGNSRRQPRL